MSNPQISSKRVADHSIIVEIDCESMTEAVIQAFCIIEDISRNFNVSKGNVMAAINKLLDIGSDRVVKEI